MSPTLVRALDVKYPLPRSHRAPSRRMFRRAIARPIARAIVVAGATIMPAGCASSGPVVVATTPGPQTTTPRGTTRPQGASAATAGWRIDVREHVDLWLHGFALLQDDASLVPYFRPGYRDTLRALRPANSGTLDANRAALVRRFGENANLTSAQFLPLYFANWDDMRRGVDRFLRDNGDVRAARSQEELRMYATIRTYFPTAEDREWLRLFVQGLDDERSRFYRGYWIQQQQRRASQRAAVTALWADSYGTAIGRFMRNNAQRTGTILLSLPLGGEGRTLAAGASDNFVTVNFPGEGDDPREAIYAIAHEVVGVVATAAVRDNASAAEERSGESGKWATLAAVRGGAMLLARVSPDLVTGYQRYYLSLARVNVGANDAASRFDATYPLPPKILDALQRQIDIVLGGI